jgi:hypothetical protein
MTTMTLGWVGAAIPVEDCQLSSPIFELSGGAISRERSYDQTVLRFESRGARTCGAGGFELSSINAILVDPDGAVIIRRSNDSQRQTVIGPVTTWAHEFAEGHLARAAAMVYDVETRIDVRRPLLRGQLGAIDLDREDRQLWPFAVIDVPADPLMEVSLSLSARRGDIEINLVAEARVCHDGHRTEFEFDLLDEQGQLVGSRCVNLSIRSGDGIGFGDTSLRLEKRVQRAVRSFELRGRTELRGLTRVGPFRMDAARTQPILKDVSAPAKAKVPATRPKAAPPKLKSVRGR